MSLPKNMTLQATVDQSARTRSRAKSVNWGDRFAWLARLILLLTVMLAPWMIASVQHWAQMVLASMLLVATGLWWFDTALNKRDSQVVPYVAIFLLLGIGLGIFQTFSLPDALADSLLGRQLELYQDYATVEFISADNESVTTGNPNRISLDVERTWHMLRLLLIALAALMLGCRYFRTRRDLTWFLAAMTLNGTALAIFGIVQKLSFNGMIYWTIPLTQGGTPFGPFVNRNNAGGFLLISLGCALALLLLLLANRKDKGPVPILSKEIPFWRQISTQILYFIGELDATRVGVLIAIILIASGVVSTLSRGAVMAMIVGGMVTIFFYGIAKKPKHFGLFVFPLIICVVALTSWIGLGSKLIERFETIDTTVAKADGRIENWIQTSKSIGEMGIFGAGLGSYASVHRIYRTDLEDTIFEYAENEYFQTIVDAGWPGFAIYMGAWAIAISCTSLLLSRGNTPSTNAVGVLAIFLISSQAVASFFDFGFYVGANMVNLVVTFGVVSYQAHSMPSRMDVKSWLGREVPNFAVSLMLVVIFGGCTMCVLDLYRKSRVDQLLIEHQVPQEFVQDDQAQTIKAIQEIGQYIHKSPSIKGMNRLGDLWVHLARVQYMELLSSVESVDNLSEAGKENLYKVWWSQTSLRAIYENKQRLLDDESEFSSRQFVNNRFIQQNLPAARRWYEVSKQQAPLQPWVHLRLGQINLITGELAQANKDLESAVRLAPTSHRLLMRVAQMYLAAGDVDSAAPHLKRILELKPELFEGRRGIMPLLVGGRLGRVPPYKPEVVLNKILPDDPKILYRFAVLYSNGIRDIREGALQRAAELMENESVSNRENVLLSGNIHLANGSTEKALEKFELALRSNPGDEDTRFKIAGLQLEVNMLDDALDNTEQLTRLNSKDRRYSQLHEQVKRAIKLKMQQEADDGQSDDGTFDEESDEPFHP